MSLAGSLVATEDMSTWAIGLGPGQWAGGGGRAQGPGPRPMAHVDMSSVATGEPAKTMSELRV